MQVQVPSISSSYKEVVKMNTHYQLVTS